MISVCMITRDDKDKLNRSLNALKDYELEVVVVDTGSVDGTKEMLKEWQNNNDKKFTLVCGDFVWCNDFSKARNYSLSLASNDKILMVDSDDVVEEMDLQRLEKLMDENEMSIGRLLIRNKINQNGIINFQLNWFAHIFDRRYYEYSGRIHEQVTPIKGSPADTGSEILPYYNAPVTLMHDGYLGTPEQRRKKAARNIALLEQEIKEKGDDPYVLCQLGKSYYLACDYKQAADCFAKALSFDLNPHLEYVIEMVETYGYALLNSGQAEAALGLENVYDTFGSSADFRLLMGHIYMNNHLFSEAVNAFLSATECKNARMEGANSYLAYYNAGVILECLGESEKAIELYSKCGEYQMAKDRIKALKNN